MLLKTVMYIWFTQIQYFYTFSNNKFTSGKISKFVSQIITLKNLHFQYTLYFSLQTIMISQYYNIPHHQRPTMQGAQADPSDLDASLVLFLSHKEIECWALKPESLPTRR